MLLAMRFGNMQVFLLQLQLTWLPNEVEHFDVVLFNNMERLLNPKGEPPPPTPRTWYIQCEKKKKKYRN